MKYKEWIEVWLLNYTKPTNKARTYENYKQMADNHIINKIGDYEIGKITPLLLQNYAKDLLEGGNKINNNGLATSTVNLIITIIQNSLKTAFMMGIINEYTANRVKRPKLKEPNVSCFNINEQRKIEQAVFSDKRDKMLGIVLCLYTGLRIGELLALTWDDINFIDKTININKTCYDKKNERIVYEPKTKSSIRIIPIPKQLIPILKAQKKKSKTKYVIEEKGKMIKIRSYQRSFSLLLKKLNINHRGFHSLRHTFATRALESGMDVKTLSEILGHKNVNITLNRYVHSLMEHKKEMMNKLGKMLKNVA